MGEFAPLIAKVDGMRRDLGGGALRKIVTDVAVQAKGDVLDGVSDDLGADRSMSGWRPGRLRFGAGFELTSDSTAQLEARPAGPSRVLEYGRRPGRKRTRRGRLVAWGATRGHRTWTRSSREIERRTPERVQKATRRVIARHFGG